MIKLLYLVTNRHIAEKNFLKIIESAVAGGVDRVILREKDLDYGELLQLSKQVKYITDKYNTPLIINSNMDVAKNIKTYGFHCGFKDFINNKYKYSGILGVSIHSIQEAIISENFGADYVLAGHIFNTKCKKGLPPKGLDFLKELKKNISIPIIAIGGINEKNARKIINAGAMGVAVMSYIMQSKNPYYSAKIISSIIN